MDMERQKKRKFNNSPSSPSSMEGISFTQTAGESEDSLSEDESLEKEILRIKSSFLRWMELTFKDPKEISDSAGHPPPSASSYLPPLHDIRPVLSECCSEFFDMRSHILQIKESRIHDEPVVDKLQQEVLAIKSRVVRRMQLLFKETVQGDLNPPPPNSYFPPVDVLLRRIPRCWEQLSSIGLCTLLIEEESLSQSQAGDELQQEIHHDFEDEEVDDDEEDMDADDDDDEAEISSDFPGQELFSWSSINGNEDTEGRYLCVSNGFAIWCLDLKQSSSSISPGPLPKIASLSLLGGQLPASVGLFKLGLDAYVIGGQKLPGSMKRLPSMFHWGRTAPKVVSIYKGLCFERGVKGSSCDIYRLSMSAIDGTLCYTVANDIEELRKPKVWPIVEKVGGKLNVVESIPFYLMMRDRRITCSHEVRDPDSGSWKEIPTDTIEMDQIRSHIVIGDRIFAVTHEDNSKHHYLVFNSRTEKWKGRRQVEELQPFDVTQVWDILRLGIGRCAGEFHCGGGGEPLYVLVAIMWAYVDWYCSGVETIAVAYIVTSTGKVVCYQELRDFFKEGCEPSEMIAGTMIHVVDDEPWGTMCSVVSGRLKKDGNVVGRKDEDHLFVNIFAVEVLPEAGLKVEELLGKGIEEDGPLAELEFVRVTPKDMHIFQTDAICDDREQFVGWRACFLTPTYEGTTTIPGTSESL